MCKNVLVMVLSVCEGCCGCTFDFFMGLQNRCICSWIEVAKDIRKVLLFHSELVVDAVSGFIVGLPCSPEVRNTEVSKIWLLFRRTTGIYCVEGFW